ncbi:MAG: methylated-DNA--[protein]-cysteine S-methyltransferase [Bryobacteraceae bacterium]|nr:methylated-DNA--[protein]-cysteine S-methyltransferase [Bryobacteraceae bacterium]
MVSEYSFHVNERFALTVAASETGITAVAFGHHGGTAETRLLAEARRQLTEWFGGCRRHFDLPLCLRGTPFQQTVWAALLEMPYGETISYLDLARRVGNVPRAVGQANGSNPVAVIVPCHRVINHNGGLGGYGGGLDVKRWLLDFESTNANKSGQLSISMEISR